MDTSLRELARRSPHNRSAFSRFSLFMKRSAKSLPPATTSPLESNEYRAMKFWASDTIVVHELMRRGYSRWTCQANAKTTNTRSLRYICMFSAMERPTVGVAGVCLGVLWNHLANVHAIEAYTSKAIIGTFRFADLVQNCVQGNAIRDRNLHIHILTKMLGAVTPYALYYSVFKLARRAQKTLEWKLPVDELLGDLPSWQEYKRTLDNMEGHRSHYKSNPQTLCANEECPNKFQTGFPMKRCTSCGVQIYCSSDCQRADWPRHRDAAKCAPVSKEREANISNAWTLQDDHIYSILLKSGLRSLGHDQPKVMRYLDFTVVPPSISIAYPEGYERSDDWETGENEERCGPFYSKFPAGRVPRVEFGNQYFDPGLYDRAAVTRMSPENPPL